MSYHGLRGYNPYYAPSPNEQNTGASYGTSRQSAPSSSLQQGTPTQQYGQSTYDWPSSTHQNYGRIDGSSQSYDSQGWRGGQNQQTSYGNQRSRNDYGAPVSNGSATTYYGTSSQPPAQSSTNALSSLAYASGLESAGLQNQHQNQTPIDRASQSNTPMSAAYPQPLGIRQERVRSPAQVSYHNYSKSSNSNSYTDNRPQSSPQNLAASAATALASAKKRQNTPASHSTNNYQQPGSYPTSMGNILSTSNNISQPPVQNRSDSPYSHQRSTSQISHQHPRTQTPSSSQYGNYSTQYKPVPTETAPHGATMDNAQPEAVRPPYQAPAQVVQSISKLQNTPAFASPTLLRDGNYNPNSLPQTESATDMPNFIDPSRVYNPYHQEYERRKKESAAEAKARTAQSNQQNTSESSQTPAISSGDKKRASKKPKSPAVSRVEKPQKPSRGKAKFEPVANAGDPNSIARESLTPQTSRPATVENFLEEEEDMESKMKTMFDGMRELRRKDPKLFGSLWDSMKKGTSSAQNRSTPTQSPQLGHSSVQKDSRKKENNHPGSAPQNATVSEHPSQPKQASNLNKNQENPADLGKFSAGRRGRYGQFQGPSATPSNESIHGSGILNQLNTNTEPQKPLALQATPQQQPQQENQQVAQPSFPNAPAMANSSAKLQWKDSKASSPQTAPPGNGTTIWPEAKRKTLSDAAVKILMSDPTNKNKQIRPEEIHALLEQNPSYLELCEKLEAKGFIFHRGHFARHLLNAVPDIKSSSGQSQSPTVRVDVPSPSPQVKSVSPAIPQSFNNTALPPPPLIKPELPASSNKAINSKKTPPVSRPAKSLGQKTAPIPKPAPGSKEAQARKRDFSELVDLTLLSDDENYVMPSKKPRTEEEEPQPQPAPVEIFQPNVNINAQGSSLLHGNLMNVFHADPFVPTTTQDPAAQPPFYPPPPHQTHFNYPFEKSQAPQLAPKPPPSISTKPSSSFWAKSMDRKEAMQKRYYNPKTIARDVLIASGRHPTERPLNEHLMNMARSFGLNFDADLSTFDWDSVDPGGPPIRPIQIADIPAGPPKWAIGQRIHFYRSKEHKSLQSNNRLGTKGLASGSSAAQLNEPIRDQNDFAYPTAKHPRHAIPDIPESSFARLQNQTKALLENSEKAGKRSRRSYDAYIPQNIGRSKKAIADGERPVTPKNRQSGSSVDVPTTSPKPPSYAELTHGSKPKMDHQLPTIKRRGRPPGSKNKNPSKPSPRDQLPTGVQVQIPVRTPPRFQTYYCEWQGCNSRLHNLATLRKHLRRHFQPDENQQGKVPCLWKGCRTIGNGDVRLSVTFPTEDAWRAHMESEHIEPIAMRFGDGPSTVYSGKHNPATAPNPVNLSKFAFAPSVMEIGPMPMPFTSRSASSSHASARRPGGNPKPLKVETPKPTTPTSVIDPTLVAAASRHYLTDSSTGEPITPPANRSAMTAYPPDALVFPAEKKPQKDFLRAHGNPELNEVKSATEVVRALAGRKEKVPGIERGGCTLVNEERRGTLAQDEAFWGVVEDERLDSD